ncbi:sugar transferase [Labrenzia sp. R4_2]|uniref:sugar transferase n=1 Tax=Labrenzia sp. R4_2 TaxID=2821107 RepID=UPI002570E594|nr:sugar transferase [Labrenzia sp. R4_2]
MADETLTDEGKKASKHHRFGFATPSSGLFRGTNSGRMQKIRGGAAQRILTARQLRKAASPYAEVKRPVYEAKPLQRALKRVFDVTGALAGLVFLFPLLAGIALTIKLTSRGPVFFRQTRLGINGQPFSILKYRTMFVDQCDHTGLQHTIVDDQRVTWIGRFLRQSSFDELPQLWNVLRGQMSLVGPRPYVPGMQAGGVPYECLDYRYYDRLQVLPGITGLAQVNGYRGDASDADLARMRLEYDLAYIENVSLWLDVKIVARTVAREFLKGSGA